MQYNKHLVIRHHPLVYRLKFALGVVLLLGNFIFLFTPNKVPQNQNIDHSKGSTLYRATHNNIDNIIENTQTVIFVVCILASWLIIGIGYLEQNTILEINGKDARYKDFFKTINIKSFESIYVENLAFIPLSSRVLITGKGLNKIEMKYVDNIKTIQKYSEELQDTNNPAK